jgi:alkylation response protein AidB-like acyl-CoA dehydrogenase
MLHDPIPQASTFAALAEAIAQHAAVHDSDGSFPEPAFEELRARGHVAHPPLTPSQSAELLHLLSSVGRGDLNVGRIFEGHVNALFLIDRFATETQRATVFRQAGEGALFGVWNTDLPGNPLSMDSGILKGAKSFASGVDGLTAAIVTVDTPEGRQMLLVPTEPLSVDRSWWRPAGMRASGSHIASTEGLPVTEDMLLGASDDYIREPFFSGGAIRFVAVQTGGIHALFDCAVEHLRRTQRADNAHQSQRIALMGIALQTAYDWLERGADAWADALQNDSDQRAGRHLIATTQAARGAVERAALDVLELAECAIGAAGFNAPHPLERLDRDLRTYLRQPNPDGAMTALGAAIAEGAWTPAFPPVTRSARAGR